MSLGKQLLASILIVVSHGALAEVFKCIDERGFSTYQDRPCPHDSRRSPVDTRYASSLPLKVPDADQEILEQIGAANRARDESRREAMSASLTRRQQAFAQKRAQCLALRAELNALRETAHRDTAGGAAESDLMLRMRGACSGW